MNLQLNGKLALVSGSTAGIGYAIARTLAQEGAAVIVNGRRQDAVDDAAARIRSETQGIVHGHAADLSNAEATLDTVQRFPGIGILVKNLGIFEPKPSEDIPDEDWRRFFDVNVLSGVRLARLVTPRDAARELGANHLHLQGKRHMRHEVGIAPPLAWDELHPGRLHLRLLVKGYPAADRGTAVQHLLDVAQACELAIAER